MKKYILWVSCFIYALLPCMGMEQTGKPTDASIFGHITDIKTKEHLAYISVSIKGTKIGTTSDASGHFLLENLPEGDWILEFKSVGYKTSILNVSVVKKKTIELDIELTPDLISLDEVVVSSNRNETAKRLAPSLINILNTKLFEDTHSSCLAQGLDFQSGVRVENTCHTCGSDQVRINGLEGSYSQILIDSRPIFSSLAGLYGLEQIPQNMIERVEIVKGGGSTLFGSSAIAGTINVITREPTRSSGEFSHDITSIGGTNSFDNNTSLNASLVTDDRKAGLIIFGQSRYRDGYSRNNDGYTNLPKMNIKTLGVKSYFKTSDNSKLSFEYHNITDYRRGGNMLSRPPHYADVAEEACHSINGGGLNFDLSTLDHKHKINLYTSMQSISRKSYSGTDQNPGGYGNTNERTYVTGGQYTYDWEKCIFLPAQFTAGAEYIYDKLHDEILGYNRNIKQTVYSESAFLQNEWKNETFGILVGGRVDKHNMVGHPIFSPRITLRYNPDLSVNLRFSYSTGFRAPQLYDDDLHVSAVGGEIATVHSALGLKPEKSESFSTSVDFYNTIGEVPVNIRFEGFYTNLKNVFVLNDIGKDSEGNILKERSNGSGAKVMGVTAEGKVAFSTILKFEAGATLQSSRYNETENWSATEDLSTRKMLRTPDLYGYFTSRFTPVKRFETAISGTYTGSMLVPHAAGYIEKDINIATPGFFNMNVKVSYTLTVYQQIAFQLSTGVQNLFNAYQSDQDKGKFRDSDYIYGPALPRSYFVGAKINF